MILRTIVLMAAALTTAIPASAASAQTCRAMNSDLAKLAAQIQADDALRTEQAAAFEEARDARNNLQTDLEWAQINGSDAEIVAALQADYDLQRDAAETAKADVDALNTSLAAQAAAFNEKSAAFNAKCVAD